ncbi:MAG: right-handed parallel beta-helix repeat-containing protein [Patescibacteria group bacterium]
MRGSTVLLKGTIGSLGADEWKYSGGNLYLGSDPSGNTFEIAQRMGISTNDKDYITIDGLVIEYFQGEASGSTNGGGIYATPGSDYININNNTIQSGTGYGACVRGATNVTIDNNIINLIESQQIGTQGDGIFVSWEIATEKTPEDIVISNNVIGGGADSIDRQGIAVVDADGMDIFGNTISGGHAGVDFEPNAGTNEGIDNGNVYENTINKVANTRGSTTNSGIAVSGVNSSAVKIYNNTITLDDSGDTNGIYAGDFGGSGCEIYGNIITNTRRGMDIGANTYPTGAWLVYRNYMSGGTINHLYGIDLGTSQTLTVTVYNNVINGFNSSIYNNTVAGGIAGIFYDNVFYGYTAGNGIYVGNYTGHNFTIKNNIFGSTPSTRHVRFSAGMTAVADYNNYAVDGAWWMWNGVASANFTAWQSASGESNGFVTNPVFTNANGDYSAAADFQLAYNSPAIDAGTDVSLATDYAGFPIYGLPDIGAYEYQPPYTVGTNAIPKTGSIRIYSNGKYRALTASTTTETIATSNFSVVPAGGGYYTASTSAYMDISITEWSTTGAKNKSWIATSSATAVGQTHATSTIHTIGDLLASTYYTFKIDNIATTTAITGYGDTTCSTSYGNGTNLTCLSDSSGIIQFTYSGGYSTHTFSLEKDTAAPSSFTLSSPADNTVNSEARPTLSWNASSDTESGIEKYRLYIDNILDTDNIANTATSRHPTQNFSCGAHTWYIAALDNNGNTTNSNTLTYTRDCNTVPSYLFNQQNQSVGANSGSDDDNETGDGSSDDSSGADIGDSSGTAANASEGSDDNKNSNSETPKTATPALETLQSEAKAIASKAKNALTSFITAGTGTTKILGSGERSGVIASFKSAFGRNPATETDWNDIIKIANGRWPGQKNTVTEKNAEAAFKKIYLREPDKTNTHDNNAIAVISYGLRPANRNLNSEKQAIKSFKFIYGYAPKSAMAWDIVRAIAYSGAKR